MKPMPLDERLTRRISRYHALYQSSRPGDILIVNRPSWVTKKDLPLYDFENGGHIDLAKDMLLGTEKLLAMNGDLDDDLIPWLTTDFGIAIHHTFLADMPVRFAEWTSWAEHPFAGRSGAGGTVVDSADHQRSQLSAGRR